MNQIQPASSGDGHLIRRMDVPSEYYGYQAPAFDGSRLRQFIGQNYKLFLAIVFVSVAAVAIYTATLTPTYTTKSTVVLEQRKREVVKGLDEVVSNLPSEPTVVDTEVQLLSSADMAFRVARAQGLLPSLEPDELSPDQQQEAARVVEQIMKKSRIQRAGPTYIIDIYYSSQDPYEAKSMADQYARTYINSQIDVRVQANEHAAEHLRQEITKLEDEVKAADANIAAYKAQNNLTDTSGGTLTEQEISSYNQALALARSQSAEDAQRLAAARTQLRQGVERFGDANSGGIQRLRAQQSELIASIADMQTHYGPNHPALVAARNQLADVNRLIAEQGARDIASLETQAKASAGRAGALAGKLSATESELKRGSAASVELHELQMKLEAPKTLLNAYQTRLAQISTQSGTEEPDARIASLATLPLNPSSPNWLINLVLGAGFGMGLGIVTVLGKHLLATGVSSPEDVEGNFGVNFLAALPRLDVKEDIALIDYVVDQPGSPFAEAVRALAASLLHGSQFQSRALAVTSPHASEGKTTTTIALGRILASRGLRVLMIDADLQRPTLAVRYGIGKDVGLVELLKGEVTPDEAIVPDPKSYAMMLPLGKMATGEAMDHDALRQLVAQFKTGYDVVLLDLPPVMQVAETRLIAAAADETVVVARWKKTSRQSIEYALTALVRTGAKLAGIALTDVPSSSEILLTGYSEETVGKTRLLFRPSK